MSLIKFGSAMLYDATVVGDLHNWLLDMPANGISNYLFKGLGNLGRVIIF